MVDRIGSHTILFVGAHADDMEIAAGATAALLNQRGYRCALIVATREKDPDIFKRRHEETMQAAKHLFFDTDLVGCLELPDGHVQCNGESVKILRDWLVSRKIVPDLVFTHLPQDKHNDHRAVYEIVCSAVRSATIVGMAVVNSLARETFRPQVFVECQTTIAQKMAALEAHKSQSELGRIRYDEIEKLETEHGEKRELGRVESFQILHDGDGIIGRRVLQELNCCFFSVFWKSMLSSEPLVILSEEFGMDYKDHNPFKEPRTAIDKLRKRLELLFPEENDVTERSSSDPAVGKLLETSHVLLTGGAISNLITRNNFNRYPFLRYVVEHDMPRYRNARIIDRKRRRDIKVVFVEGASGEPVISIDYGILSVLPNPEVHENDTRRKWMVAAMGIHGWGGVGVMKSITEFEHLRQYINKLAKPGETNGFQVIVKMDVGAQKTSIDWDSVEWLNPGGELSVRKSRSNSTPRALKVSNFA